jgi:Rrf2 family protein
MSKIFTLSEAASIAIHSMVLIARNDKGINAVQIAEQTGLSKNHISKVLQRLVKNDLLKSVRGPLGGFTLKKMPKYISLLSIYETIEGTLGVTDCPFSYEICAFEKCLMGTVINKMTLDFRKYLKTKTLADYM